MTYLKFNMRRKSRQKSKFTLNLLGRGAKGFVNKFYLIMCQKVYNIDLRKVFIIGVVHIS